MNIIGPDAVVFGVDDVEVAAKYMTDFGLKAVGQVRDGLLFETCDGTGVIICASDDPALPPPLSPTNKARKIVYGVADAQSLEEIAAELGKDREVKRLADGAIESLDDMGIPLVFQLTRRREIEMPVEKINAPGAPLQRAVNVLGVDGLDALPAPRSLGHFALFVPDVAAAEKFYVERLQFRVNDRLGGGPFMRSKGTYEHHTMFLIQTPPQLKGVEHMAFHLGGPSEVMQAGHRFRELGYSSFWGPGRHGFGSNWFWYFDSPLGCRFEYDADMDKFDDDWVPRELPLHADNAQAYLLDMLEENWAPFNGPRKPSGGAAA
ncbi:VOC family protein [Pseudomonas lalucatii]|uniref:VOC family protein n=1 Tax=Pseudomonas lalucatii TaxID=1424203 RepID=A0ABS5Q4W8_9PSED|nr:VOC family protein [Pseudomonas lalucatii]MBS7663620.1 VOC family protein [Pseudomonas lalucatii]QVM86912.1 VOC family protein [Pseudomonas lalucatii]